MNSLVILVCFIIFVLLILWINKLIQWVGATSYLSKSIVMLILIVALAIMPVYFYQNMPSSFDFVAFYSDNLFGLIPISVFIIMLKVFWIYLLSCLIFQYMYKITLENAVFITLLFYLPFFIITAILFVIKYMDLHSITIFSVKISLDWLY
ncbi:hypothetical protein A9G13_07935 [Gilliamella sp. wkB178]|nr:hypothetical protein A9G13_07935 [Gilliamella apicola]